MPPKENAFQLFARSVFKFPPTREGKSDSEPREPRLFDRSCVTRRGTHSFPPDSHFVVQTRIQGMPLLDLIVSSVGSTPRGEHAADLASRRERSCRWNTFKRVFLREKMVADGSLDLMKLSFDETREEILCLIAVIYLLLALNRSTDPLFAMKTRSSWRKKIRLYRDDFFFRIRYFREIKFRFVRLFLRLISTFDVEL